MTRDEKALLYDDYVREGDRINRSISRLKAQVNITSEQETELTKLNKQLADLEAKVEALYVD